MEVIAPPWSVWADQRVTRRKYYHSVTTPSGETVFSSRLLAECIDFLVAQDQLEFQLNCAETPPVVCRISLPSPKEH